jgi:hypothetical protein
VTADGQVRVALRQPWADGTTHVVFDAVEFLGRLAVLVPRPRVNLILYYGFDVRACPRCGGRLRLIALIEEAAVIGRILGHLGLPTDLPVARHARAPPLFAASADAQDEH